MTATKAELAKSYSVHATTVRRDAAVTAGGWHTPQRYATIRAMPGRLDLRSLEALVRGGEIDTVLMEMEPLPGFKLTSWERGYGDMKLVPDLPTLRRIPWLPGTALVFCDVQ